MEYLNKVEIRGVIGQVHITKVADTETAQFSVLTEDVFRSKDGGAAINCTWFSVRAWKGRGIVELEKLQKGSKVHVIGRFRCQKYVGSDGCEKTCYEVIASTVELVEGGNAMKPGDKIKVIRMDDGGGKDWQARELNGKTYTISFIDSAGQIHLEETGLALIPGVDIFVPV